MTADAQPGCGWAVLRRMPARIVAGRAEGGYTSAFEIVCRDCGDDPCLDYRDVSRELQAVRGPYLPIAAGVAAYAEHLALHAACPGEGGCTPAQLSRSGGI
jgi:hypothetical protein